jgi:hypothetical protein
MIAVLQSRGVEGIIKANSDQQRLRAWRSGCPVSAAPVNLVDQLWGCSREDDVGESWERTEGERCEKEMKF